MMVKNHKKIETEKIKIGLLGLGLDNQALLGLFDKHHAPAEITICDFRQKEQLPLIKVKNLNINYRLGTDFNRNLNDFSLLFRSPGWPLSCPGIQAALKSGKTKLSSPLNLFFELSPSKNIIGVTGSKGKGTTATLIYKIIKKQLRTESKGSQVFLGGNIGVPPLSFLEKIKVDDYVVLELSSFQLEDLAFSPRWAVITNLFKEHLSPADPNNPNFHASFSKYWQAKLSIANKSQNKALFVHQSLANKLKKEKLPGKIFYFQTSDLPSKLSGAYNQQNIAAAVSLAQHLKIKPKIYQQVIASFRNLEHRLEFVAEKNNVKYFDNSFATTPESTMLDLQSFSGRIIQIAGGADKGADFNPLSRIMKEKTAHLILLPGAGSEKLAAALKKSAFPVKKIDKVSDMSVAVALAKRLARPGDTVLLSTACASFGIFKNYKERGDLFKKYVRQR